MKNTVTISERYIKASQTKGFSYTDELNILEHLLNKFKPLSKTEYANKENISIPAVNDRIKRGKVMSLEIINRTFIFE
jgi:hypothetical protein